MHISFCILGIYIWNFNELLTNDVVSFEQQGPDLDFWNCLEMPSSYNWRNIVGKLMQSTPMTFEFIFQYGYRLPESDEEMIYYQIHFGPLGGRLLHILSI